MASLIDQIRESLIPRAWRHQNEEEESKGAVEIKEDIGRREEGDHIQAGLHRTSDDLSNFDNDEAVSTRESNNTDGNAANLESQFTTPTNDFAQADLARIIHGAA
jgi:hypothetical protein